MYRLMPFLLLLLVGAVVSTSEGLVTRGVQVKDHEKYLSSLSSGVFQCFDGRITIPVDQVNDDYCDCVDGSDEPGTSACNVAVGFWCKNDGFRPEHLASSRVGDGICDCCDGTDEAGHRGAKCENSCAAKAALLAQEEAARRQRIERARGARESAKEQVLFIASTREWWLTNEAHGGPEALLLLFCTRDHRGLSWNDAGSGSIGCSLTDC